MQLVFDKGVFLFKCKYEERKIPKSVGFDWDTLRPKRWTTRDPLVAQALLQHATPAAYQIIKTSLERRKQSFIRSSALDSNIEILVPEGLEYLPFQLAGIEYAIDHPRCYLADDMGLGKTVECIGVVNYDSSIKRVLVIAKANLKLMWRDMFELWQVRDMGVGLANGNMGYDVLITNFEQIIPRQQISWSYVDGEGNHLDKPIQVTNQVPSKVFEYIMSQDWDLIIVDESHKIKNEKAKRTHAVTQIVETKGHYRVIFTTGTPLPSRPLELYPQIRLMIPHTKLADKKYFTKRYCDPQEGAWYMKGEEDLSGYSNLEELQTILRSTCMIRRTKEECLPDLPPKTRQIIAVQPDTKQLVAIEAELKAYQEWETAKEQFGLLKASLKANQIDKDSYKQQAKQLKQGMQVAFTELSKMRHKVGWLKVPAVIEHLQDLLEQVPKVVVFAHHLDILDAIEEKFKGICVKYSGQTPDMAARKAMEVKFQTDPKCRLFIGQTLAAGEGITLTASSTVVFAELDWVPGNLNQAEDRCRRIGQLFNVLVHHLIFDGSLDKKMVDTVIEKQYVIDTALDTKPSQAVLEFQGSI